MGKTSHRRGTAFVIHSYEIRGVNPSIVSGNKSDSKDTDRDSHKNLNSKSYQAVDLNSVKIRIKKKKRTTVNLTSTL